MCSFVPIDGAEETRKRAAINPSSESTNYTILAYQYIKEYPLETLPVYLIVYLHTR